MQWLLLHGHSNITLWRDWYGDPQAPKSWNSAYAKPCISFAKPPIPVSKQQCFAVFWSSKVQPANRLARRICLLITCFFRIIKLSNIFGSQKNNKYNSLIMVEASALPTTAKRSDFPKKILHFLTSLRMQLCAPFWISVMRNVTSYWQWCLDQCFPWRRPLPPAVDVILKIS